MSGRGKARLYTYKGQSVTLRDLQALSGLKRRTLEERLKSGLSIDEAISLPLKEQRLKRELTVNGERTTLAALARGAGLSRQNLSARLKAGWTLEQALAIPTPKQRRRGVVFNFDALLGTGGGRNAQDRPDIDFSGDQP